jgi:hypothetical protein
MRSLITVSVFVATILAFGAAGANSYSSLDADGSEAATGASTIDASDSTQPLLCPTRKMCHVTNDRN